MNSFTKNLNLKKKIIFFFFGGGGRRWTERRTGPNQFFPLQLLRSWGHSKELCTSYGPDKLNF